MKKESSKKGKKKAGKVLAIIGIVLALIFLVYGSLLLFEDQLFYKEFYKTAEKGAEIPGYSDGFVPQGVTALEGSDETLVCGYMSVSQNSRIYRITADGKITKILLEKEDGTAYTGHAGGFTAAGKYIYVSNAQKIFVLDAASVFSAKDGDTVRFMGSFEVPCRSSFCSSDGTMLYVGEYHADGYETDSNHTMETKSGTYQALVFAYRLSEGGTYGIENTVQPVLAYAVCDNVQGFAVLPDGTAVLSCSAGFQSSRIRFYRTDGENDMTLPMNGKGLPIKYLDVSREIKTLKAPRMSEDLDYRNQKLYVGFEAGAKKFGARLLPFTMKNVMLLKMD